MTLEWIRFVLVALCLLGGVFTLLTAILGLFRFRHALTRIHAAAMADTLALFLILLGLLIAAGPGWLALKLILVLALQWATSPLSSHMLAQFEYRTNPILYEYMELPEDAHYRSENAEDKEEAAV